MVIRRLNGAILIRVINSQPKVEFKNLFQSYLPNGDFINHFKGIFREQEGKQKALKLIVPYSVN
jgi:hypothetical protein